MDTHSIRETVNSNTSAYPNKREYWFRFGA